MQAYKTEAITSFH